MGKSRRITERDLRSQSNTRWAAAVVHAARNGCHNPYCGADGFCHAGGSCFSPLSSGSMRKSDLAQAIDDLHEALREQLNQVDELKKELKRVQDKSIQEAARSELDPDARREGLPSAAIPVPPIYDC